MFFVVMLMFLAVMIAMITFAPITASVTIFITLTARWLLHGAALTMPLPQRRLRHRSRHR